MSHIIDLFLSCGLTAGTNNDITPLRLRPRCITASFASVPIVGATVGGILWVKIIVVGLMTEKLKGAF